MTRHCPCGARLADDNIGVMCLVCQNAYREANLKYGTGRVVRRARSLADVYGVPERFISAEAYLEALTAGLDALCRSLEMRIPRLEGSRFDASVATGSELRRTA